MTRYLVLVHHDGDLAPLIEELCSLASDEPCRFHVVVPLYPLPGTTNERAERAAAGRRLRQIVDAIAAHGLAVDGEIGDESVVHSVVEADARSSYLGLVVSTPPAALFSAFHLDVVHRLRHVLDVPIIHVVAHDGRVLPHGEPSIGLPLDLPARARDTLVADGFASDTQ